MSLDVLYENYLDSSEGCLVVQAEAMRELEGACIPEQNLWFMQLREVTQDEIDKYNESVSEEDQLNDIDKSVFLLSICKGRGTYDPQDNVLNRRMYQTCLEEYQTFESAFNEVKSVLKEFLKHYDLNNTTYQVTTRCDDKYEECQDIIRILVEQMKAS